VGVIVKSVLAGLVVEARPAVPGAGLTTGGSGAETGEAAGAAEQSTHLGRDLVALGHVVHLLANVFVIR
jgi:hypothetical protein